MTNQDINANEEIWKFFKKYSLPETNATSQQQKNTGVYPNPASDFINLTYNNISQLKIFNTFGQVVFENPKIITDQSIDIRTFQSGLYFVKFLAEGKPLINTFIKL
ncbi:MAG: T9SS type A sorting domain-containing protein [Saprospiraceae bacterium]|nr:T9SS type A sorting domain-containing protein [Saprospiraceae bacterium]